MKVYLSVLFCCFAFSSTSPVEDPREVVPPQYLDLLLREERYEEFNRLMGIDIPHLSRPRIGNETYHPRFSPYLEHGDILLTPKQKEEARQGTKHANLKWDTKYIPYYVNNDFTSSEKRTISDGIKRLNTHCGGCIQLRRYSGEKHYIYVHKGNGCFSNLGKTGGQQELSLGDGCIDIATVVHEFMHALGFYHEHCRPDRDESIYMLWGNIVEDWKSQFYKESSNDVLSYGDYDCYSVMHYPMRHPDVSNNKPCFEIYDSSIDEDLVGYAEDATESDAKKLRNMYCKN